MTNGCTCQHYKPPSFNLLRAAVYHPLPSASIASARRKTSVTGASVSSPRRRRFADRDKDAASTICVLLSPSSPFLLWRIPLVRKNKLTRANDFDWLDLFLMHCKISYSIISWWVLMACGIKFPIFRRYYFATRIWSHIILRYTQTDWKKDPPRPSMKLLLRFSVKRSDSFALVTFNALIREIVMQLLMNIAVLYSGCVFRKDRWRIVSRAFYFAYRFPATSSVHHHRASNE